MRTRIALVLTLLFILVVGKTSAGLTPQPRSFDSQIQVLVAPYTFNFVAWEMKTLGSEIFTRRLAPPSDAMLSVKNVLRYFSYIELAAKMRADIQDIQGDKSAKDLGGAQSELSQVQDQIDSLRPVVEATLEDQVGQALAAEGIYSPLANGLRMAFPPVNFKLEKPLHVLIVSPRDKIDRLKDVTLIQDISESEMNSLESKVDILNVSSLVIQIGGLGATFPSFVDGEGDLKWTLETVAHEWVHQYLAFKPLGSRYILDLLGLSSQPDIDTLNETLAGMVGKEIGDAVYSEYYAAAEARPAPAPAVSPGPSFDFNAAMRETRQQVDNLLAQGQVQQAETYMEEERQVLVSHGYSMRKLNQAYFAFYGSYADSPTSIDPIGKELNALRQQTPTLQGFLETAAGLTSKADLEKLLD